MEKSNSLMSLNSNASNQTVEELPYFPEKYPGKVCILCNLGERSQLGQGEILRLQFNENEQKELSAKSNLLSIDQRNSNGSGKSQINKISLKCTKNSTNTGDCYDDLERIGHLESYDFKNLLDANNNFYIHRLCATWSFGVIREINGSLRGVSIIVAQSLKRICSYCKHYGASLECKMSCPNNFHFPCVAASGGTQIISSFSSFCKDHVNQISAICTEELSLTKCRICFELGNTTNLVMCTKCGDLYHGTCIGLPQLPVARAGWQCKPCSICQICRLPDATNEARSLACEQCHKTFHALCLRPIMSTIPKYGWKCRSCRICSDCGSRTPGAGSSSRWHAHYTICDSCYQQRNKGFFCPICHRAYRAAANKEMVKCSFCNKFVHGTCDNDADLQVYHVKKENNPDYEYLCPPCKNVVQNEKMNHSQQGLDEETISNPQENNNVVEEFENELVEKSSDFGLGKGKPFAVAARIAKKRIGLMTGGKTKVGGKGAGQKQRQRFVETFGSVRKRGTKSKIRNVFGSFDSTLKLQINLLESTDASSSNKADDDPANENRIILCSAKDKFVLTQDLCVMCGAVGTDEEGCLISCTQCGQCYHPYCINVKITKVILDKGWRCLDCTVCEGCGQKNDESRLILCDECDISFHIYCMDPPMDFVPQGNWKCKRCAICQKCGKNIITSGFSWKNCLSECAQCTSEEVCHLCSENYQDSDLMMKCKLCEKWSHGSCSYVKSESEAKTFLDKGYLCPRCKPKNPTPPPIEEPPNEDEKNESIEKYVTEESTNIVQLSISSTHYVDGVYLNDSGFVQIKSLQIDIKRKRKPKPQVELLTGSSSDGIMASIESVVCGGNSSDIILNSDVAIDYKDGMAWDIETSPPEGFVLGTNENGLAVLKKKRQRNLQKLGIGGFNVRNRAQKKDPIMDEQDGSLGNAMHLGEFDKRKKIQRKKQKLKLSETYPTYLQEAFFGKGLLDNQKSSLINMDSSTSDDEIKSNLSEDKILNIPSLKIKISTNSIPLIKTKTIESNDKIDSIRQGQTVENIKSSESQENFLAKSDVIKMENSVDVNQITSIQTPQQFGNIQKNTSVLNSIKYNYQQTPPPHNVDIQQKPQYSGELVIKTEDRLENKDNKNRIILMENQMSPNIASKTNKLSAGEEIQNQLSCTEKSSERMRRDEELGTMSTISAVLYANTNHPQLKIDYPSWNERCKQIYKRWRTLSNDLKAPYLQKARDNRSALRTKKLQQDQEKQSAQPKVFKEQEQERLWKQHQAMRVKEQLIMKPVPNIDSRTDKLKFELIQKQHQQQLQQQQTSQQQQSQSQSQQQKEQTQNKTYPDKLYQEVNPNMGEMSDILGDFGNEDDDLFNSFAAEMGTDFNILKYADPELDALADCGNQNLLDNLEFDDNEDKLKRNDLSKLNNDGKQDENKTDNESIKAQVINKKNEIPIQGNNKVQQKRVLKSPLPPPPYPGPPPPYPLNDSKSIQEHQKAFKLESSSSFDDSNNAPESYATIIRPTKTIGNFVQTQTTNLPKRDINQKVFQQQQQNPQSPQISLENNSDRVVSGSGGGSLLSYGNVIPLPQSAINYKRIKLGLFGGAPMWNLSEQLSKNNEKLKMTLATTSSGMNSSSAIIKKQVSHQQKQQDQIVEYDDFHDKGIVNTEISLNSVAQNTGDNDDIAVIESFASSELADIVSSPLESEVVDDYVLFSSDVVNYDDDTMKLSTVFKPTADKSTNDCSSSFSYNHQQQQKIDNVKEIQIVQSNKNTFDSNETEKSTDVIKTTKIYTKDPQIIKKIQKASPANALNANSKQKIQFPCDIIGGNINQPLLAAQVQKQQQMQRMSEVTQTTAKVAIGNTTISVPLLKTMSFTNKPSEKQNTQSVAQSSKQPTILNVRGSKLNPTSIMSLSQFQIKTPANAKIVQVKLAPNTTSATATATARNISTVTTKTTGVIHSIIPKLSQFSVTQELPNKIFEDNSTSPKSSSSSSTASNESPKILNTKSDNIAIIKSDLRIKKLNEDKKLLGTSSDNLLKKTSPAQRQLLTIPQLSPLSKPTEMTDQMANVSQQLRTIMSSFVPAVSKNDETLTTIAGKNVCSVVKITNNDKITYAIAKNIQQQDEKPKSDNILLNAITKSNEAKDSDRKLILSEAGGGNIIEKRFNLDQQKTHTVASTSITPVIKRSKSTDEGTIEKELPAQISTVKRYSLEIAPSDGKDLEKKSTEEMKTKVLPTKSKSDETQNVLLKQLLQSSGTTGSTNITSQTARKLHTLRAPSLGLVSSLEAQLARPVIPPIPADSSSSINQTPPKSETSRLPVISSESQTSTIQFQSHQKVQQSHQQKSQQIQAIQQKLHFQNQVKQRIESPTSNQIQTQQNQQIQIQSQSQPTQTSQLNHQSQMQQQQALQQKNQQRIQLLQQPQQQQKQQLQQPFQQSQQLQQHLQQQQLQQQRQKQQLQQQLQSQQQIQSQHQLQTQQQLQSQQQTQSQQQSHSHQQQLQQSQQQQQQIGKQKQEENHNKPILISRETSFVSNPTYSSLTSQPNDSKINDNRPEDISKHLQTTIFGIASTTSSRIPTTIPSPVTSESKICSSPHQNMSSNQNNLTFSSSFGDSATTSIVQLKQETEIKRKRKRDYQKTVNNKKLTLPNKDSTATARKRTKKMTKMDEDFDSFIDNLMSQLRQMSPLQVLEPLLNRNYNACQIFGTGDLSKPPLEENCEYGCKISPKIPDFYNEKPFGSKDISNPNDPQLIQNGFYDQEFPQPKPKYKSYYEEKFNFILKSRDLETPDCYVLSSSPECVMGEDNNFSNSNCIIEKFTDDYKRSLGNVSPTINLIAPIPIKPYVCGTDILGKTIENKNRKRHKRYGDITVNDPNVTITLTLTSCAAKNILGALKELAHILNITPPVSYTIVDREDAKSTKVDENIKNDNDNDEQVPHCKMSKMSNFPEVQNILNGNGKLCFNCNEFVFNYVLYINSLDLPEVVSKKLKVKENPKKLYFCTKKCYKKFQWTNGLCKENPNLPNFKKEIVKEETLETLVEKSEPQPLIEAYKFYGDVTFTSHPKYKKPTDKEIVEKLFRMAVTVMPTTNPTDDKRNCILCGQIGDGVSNGTSRLLNYDVEKWIHLNCALWSDGVYETESGALMNLETTVNASSNQFCFLCNESGATVKCFKNRCSSVYHLNCAVKDNCIFYKNKATYCSIHAPKNEKENELFNLSVLRRVYVERDENRQVAAIMHQSEVSNLLRVGSLIFLNVGQLLPHQLTNFHTPNYIFPVGYKIIRFYWSMKHPNKRCRYVCSIADVGGCPEFRIVVKENNEDDMEFKANSAKLAWKNIIKAIASVRKLNDMVQLFPQFITGEDLFGLTEPAVVRILESLPGIDTLADYKFKYGRNPLLELPLAINPSGAARTEPKQKQSFHWKKSHTQRTSSASSPQQRLPLTPQLSSVAGEVTCPYSKQFVHSKSSQYKKMKLEWRNNVYLARSKIQGLGLYAARDLEKHTMVIEYIGEVIRTEVSEIREKQYEAKNRGIYMFRLDENRVVDATLSGGLARYINHSCNPNCVTEIVEVDREFRIIIFAKRRILRGEELSYDYKFDIEDDANKISCMCGAPNCKKWMN